MPEERALDLVRGTLHLVVLATRGGRRRDCVAGKWMEASSDD
jgi:hypothetical protein